MALEDTELEDTDLEDTDLEDMDLEDMDAILLAVCRSGHGRCQAPPTAVSVKCRFDVNVKVGTFLA
jgi:hypothetical protein